jgi:hypothetical protein
MEKQIKQKNSNRDHFLKSKSLILNVVKKFDDYYSDVYKERILDYPMAVFSALVRISLHRVY